MIIKKIFLALILLSYALFGLDYHTDGKPIYEPIEIPVIYPMNEMARSVTLKDGWNLIGVNSDMNLNQLFNTIGSSNLEVIQGLDKTYKKQYVDDGTPLLNDFTKLERGQGYWIKVAQGVDLDYYKLTYIHKTIPLKSGWNLINPFGELTLNEILTQLGIDNVEVIQGLSKTYQKEYVDNSIAFLNDFTEFENTKGYWIKVDSSATLSF